MVAGRWHKTSAARPNDGRPLVSIITPVMNRADSIERCLESVAKQSYHRIEHIVVDGGSTDGTLELIEQYDSSWPFQVISEPDDGMYDAINKGMRLAQGDVLAYLNSDDLYFPWTVETAAATLESGADLAYGDLGILDIGDNGRARRFYVQFYSNFDLRHYSFVTTIAQPTVFWSRSLMNRIGWFDTTYRLIGDCEYWLRAALQGARMEQVTEVMAVQVDHGAALRWTQTERLEEEFNRLRTAMRRIVEPPASPEWERVKHSLTWRMRQVELLYASMQSRPSKWPRFIEALRANGVRPRVRDLRMLAPGRWRGGASMFGDPSRISGLFGYGAGG